MHRAEELLWVQRRDVRPARNGAIKRELFVRHGKGARQRRLPLANVTLNSAPLGSRAVEVRRLDRGPIALDEGSG